MIAKKKIINDPVHGFTDIPYGNIFNVVEHPYLQRLRNIRQLGMTHLVYPGACHSRFAHAIGAMHLMKQAISTLKSKGASVSGQEEEAACIAILLHDIGHGPFSHALEHSILLSTEHEEISLLLMERINREMGGAISEAIDIFTGKHPKRFLHQLVSGQLDVDRLDYLTRDSFYSGVAEGMIGLERIIEMMNISDNSLIIEAKGVHSIEKFLISRRMMYWQVYLHKTVIAAEKLTTSILSRARELVLSGEKLPMPAPLEYLLEHGTEKGDEILDNFVKIDDSDITSSIKMWQESQDKILRELSISLCSRRLPKVEITSEPTGDEKFEELVSEYASKKGISKRDAEYFIMRGVIENKGYDMGEAINILEKDGSIRNIYDISDMLSAEAFSTITKKHFLCIPKHF